MTWRRVATAALLGVLALPLALGFDDLPLSRYPMYSTARPSELVFIVPRGITATGDGIDLPMATVAATRDPLVAESWLREAVRLGRADEACHDIAARVDDGQVTQVEVRREVHDLRARASGDPSLRTATVEASCAVE